MMNKLSNVLFVLFMAAGCAGLLNGCANMDAGRQPEEWLSLSYAGLEATDQYEFVGVMSMENSTGMKAEPKVFEGKVVDHQQLTVQTNSQDPLHIHPVKALGMLKNTKKEVRLLEGESNASTVKLLVLEQEDATLDRWKQRLYAQLDQIAANAPDQDAPYKAEWEQELSRSRQKLQSLLDTLNVQTSYEVVIDRKRLLPLVIDEKTRFHYQNNGQEVQESRSTTLRFQSFKGAVSSTVQ